MKLTAEQQRKAEENMGLVGKVIADKVHGTYFGSYTREDLFQIGCIGLCKAAATDKGPGDRRPPGRPGQLCHRLGGQGPEIPAGYELGVWRPNSVFFSTSSTVSSRFISCRTADTPNRKFSI